jgi:hypothetical protein
MQTYRTHPLYKLAQKLSGQPIDWSNPSVVRLQYEMRHDFTEMTPTLSLIGMTAGVDDAQPFANTLKEITMEPEAALRRYLAIPQAKREEWDTALGEGRN